VSLLQQPFGTCNYCTHVFRDLNLRTSEELERDHPFASFEPPLDDLPLTTRRDPRHLLDLRCGVPLLLHAIERAKAQPDHTSLLFDGLLNSANDEWVRLELLCIRSLRPPQLHALPFGEEEDLCVDVQLPARRLRLGQHCIVWVFVVVGDHSMFSLAGIVHERE
jgi:hypothetical protein